MNVQAAAALLTITEEAGQFVVGNRETGDFVAVPAIGADVLRWLRTGSDVTECGIRASATVGGPVDVDGFLNELRNAGILSELMAERPDRALPGRRIGNVLVSRKYFMVTAILFVAAVVCVVVRPRLLPRSGDFTITTEPLLNLLMLTSISFACTAAHECAHLCAASARGARARLSISRRLFFVTAQADLTRLWAVDRSQRYAPLLAGLVLDITSTSVLVIAEACGYSPSWLRSAVAIQVAAGAFQGAVFMRTDLYAVIAAASGSVHFWRLKTAVLRSCCRMATTEDGQLVADASVRELRWARTYMVVFVLGNFAAAWYLLRIALPGLYEVLEISLQVLVSAGVRDQRTWQALVALTLIVLPAGLAMLGFSRATAVAFFRLIVKARLVAAGKR